MNVLENKQDLSLGEVKTVTAQPYFLDIRYIGEISFPLSIQVWVLGEHIEEAREMTQQIGGAEFTFYPVEDIQVCSELCYSTVLKKYR